MPSLFDGSIIFILLSKNLVVQRLIIEERSVVNGHIYHSATESTVSVKEGQFKLPTLYYLPKINKYKAWFIANSNFLNC